jgi:chromosome segregation ATPase
MHQQQSPLSQVSTSLAPAKIQGGQQHFTPAEQLFQKQQQHQQKQQEKQEAVEDLGEKLQDAAQHQALQEHKLTQMVQQSPHEVTQEIVDQAEKTRAAQQQTKKIKQEYNKAVRQAQQANERLAVCETKILQLQQKLAAKNTTATSTSESNHYNMFNLSSVDLKDPNVQAVDYHSPNGQRVSYFKRSDPNGKCCNRQKNIPIHSLFNNMYKTSNTA